MAQSYLVYHRHIDPWKSSRILHFVGLASLWENLGWSAIETMSGMVDNSDQLAGE